MKSFNDELDEMDDGGFDDDEGSFNGGTFGGTPKDQYFAISRTANQNIVDLEIDTLLRRFAVAEKIIEEAGLSEQWEQMITAMVIDKELDERTGSLYIELMGNIVTQCE
jgi:hypothetical protein